MARFFGANTPFIGGNEKILSRQEDERLIRNDLLQLLLTSPGERVMRPDFGGGVRDFLFEQIDDVGIELLQNDIEEAIRKHETRVQITEVVINRNEDSNQIEIKVFGFFNFDRFNVEGAGAIVDAELLVELNIETRKINPVV